MAKLYIIAGHGAGDPGACAGGQTEEERVRALASVIKQRGGSDVEVLDTSRNWYADGGINSLSLPKGAMLLELHRDYAAESARGAHVIIYGGFDADEFDKALAAKLSAILPGRSQTIVKRTDLANPKRAANRGINYRLAEVGFISNAEDRSIFDTRITEIADAILEAAGIGPSGSASAPSAPAQQPAAKPSAPSASNSGEKTGTGFGGTYRCTVSSLNVRDAPTLGGNVVASYSKGQTVVLDDWYKIADGWVWGRYTGASSGKKRYVAVGKPTGGPAADDYLLKV